MVLNMGIPPSDVIGSLEREYELYYFKNRNPRP